MKKVKMFFVCLFACLSVFAQKSETVVSDVTTSQGTSPEYIEPFDSIQAAKIIRQLADHTKNAPVKVQLGILADLPRHFYRNLVCTLGIINRYKNNDNFSHQGKPIGYPSESNFMKLMTRPEDVLLKIDVQENTYKKMHESNLLFRNYCIEIKVASEHITRSDISQSSLADDFDNLIYKPLFLTHESGKLYALLSDTNINEFIFNGLLSIFCEHIGKLKIRDVFALIKNKETNEPKLFEDDVFNNLDAKGAFERSLNRLLEETDRCFYKGFHIYGRTLVIDKEKSYLYEISDSHK